MSSPGGSSSAEWEVAGRDEVVGWIQELVETEEMEGSAILTALHMREPRLEMSAMQEALEFYVVSVKSKTMEKMSGKYGDFARVAEAVSKQGLSDTTRASLSELHSGLTEVSLEARKKRKEIEAETQSLKTAEKNARELKAVEGFGLLLDELESGLLYSFEKQREENNDQNCPEKNIERLAHAALSLKAQLEGAVDFISDGELVTKMHEYAQRVDAAEGATRLAVEAAFETLCCRSSEKNINHENQDLDREACLRAGAALGMGPRLEEVFATKLMRPFLKASFTQGRLDGADRGSADGLPWLLSAALDYIKDRALCALRACDRAMASPGVAVLAVDLLTRGVWSQVANALLSLESLFQLGSRQKLRKSYNAVFQDFLEPLSDLVHDSTEALRRLEASDETRKLREEWNLPVYAELVKTDLMTALPLSTYDDLMNALYIIWDQCLLLPVAPDLLDLSFFLIDTYLEWADASIKKNEKNYTTEHLARLAIDLDRLESTLRLEFPTHVTRALSACSRLRSRQAPPSVAAGFTAVISPRAENLRSDVFKLLAMALADEAIAGFRLVKSVTARYHLTNAPAPKTPSEYLTKHAFPSLNHFDNTWRPLLPFSDEAQKNAFFTSVHIRTSEAYASQLTAVLDHANKFQATLARRHHRKTGTAPTLDLASDSIKIKQQLLLDLDSAIHRLENFTGISSSSNQSPLDTIRSQLRAALPPDAEEAGDSQPTTSLPAHNHENGSTPTNGGLSTHDHDQHQSQGEETKNGAPLFSPSVVAVPTPSPVVEETSSQDKRDDGSAPMISAEDQSGPPIF